MYRIYADDTLIYDSTLEDYKIGKGQITKEADKSGSFVFSVYPDHPYYNQFVRMKTVITVYKSGRIVFRGRILDDTTDYWNAKTITCEGELGFLQDSVARPFSFQGDHADLFARFIAEHNEQVDDFKRFKVGTVTVEDSTDYINRSAGGYGAMLDTMQSALTGSDLGGHFYITHGDDGTDPIPTLHYVADFPKTASQGIEFGVNLKDYTKKVSAADLATCIIPLGTSNGSDGERLTIEAKNGGKDYIYDANAVAMYGWIVKVVTWDDVTLDNHLLTKARAYLAAVVNQHATIELSAIDMHLLDRSMESYNVCEYVRATSAPHGLDALMLCSKQTMDLLKPENDTVTLGYTTGTLTGANVQLGASVSTLGKTMSTIKQDADSINLQVEEMGKTMSSLELRTDSLTLAVTPTGGGTGASIQLMAGDEKLGEPSTINITGFVTFSSLANGTTTIDGGCIKTGTISADRIDASDLVVNAANITGTLKIGVLPDGLVTEENVTTITSNAIETAEISADQITSGTLYAAALALDGAMELTEDGVRYGYLGVNEVKGGPCMSDSSGNIGVIVTNNAAKISYQEDKMIWVANGGCYSSYTMQVYSDKRLKKNISYDLADEEKLFTLLRACSFEMNSDANGKTRWGFIAQDLIAAATEAGMDADKLAIIGSYNGMYSIAYGELTALNTHMIQKLMARVAKLEAKA